MWTEEGSPLAAITARQAKALQGAFGENVIVDHAMRYGQPAIAERIDALKAAGLRAHPDRAALPAILRGDDGDRE